MIGYVNGILADVDEDSVTVDLNGLGVQIRVGAGFLCEISQIGTQIKIYTYTYVKEDAFMLYGFRTKDELDLFRKLISVSGIGPKGGLALLSVLSADDLRFAIYAGDAKTIAKAPGIGKKTAERLVLELKDKVIPEDNDSSALLSEIASSEMDEPRRSRKDAIDALTALGYNSMEAAKAVKSVNPPDDMAVEDILKAALKFLL